MEITLKNSLNGTLLIIWLINARFNKWLVIAHGVESCTKIGPIFDIE